MRLKKISIALIAIILAAAMSYAAFAVIDPASGTSTPNGDFIFAPNQTGASSIEVIRTSDDSAVQAINVASGTPASMATSPDGKTLFVVVTGATGSRVRSYSINQTTGALTSLSYTVLSSTYTAGRQCAITPDGRYLYVTNYDDTDASAGRRVYILDVSNPSAMTVAGSFQVAASATTVNIWGIAIKPDGTRLYVGDRYNSKVYVYNIVDKINPALVTTISLDTTKKPTYIAVNSDGDRLFVKVDETTDPGDGARKDVLVYDISGATPVRIAEVFKIRGNDYRSYLPGDHLTTGYDLDTRNGSEGLALSPNGWFMYFSNYNGPSADGRNYYRDTLYGSSVKNLNSGFDRTDAGDIWISWGGCTQESPAIWGGWHSSDGLIATRKNKVYFTYSDVSVTPEYLGVWTTTEAYRANVAPTAPKITHPTQEANVSGFITWEPSLDDGLGAHGLTYTVQTIEASVLEAGTTTWNHMAYTATSEIYTPLIGVTPGVKYYARVQAYDGTFTSAWSYTGPFTMDVDFLLPPTWESCYLVTSREAVIDWAIVTRADSYIIEYKTTTEATWHRTSSIPSTTRHNPVDFNPNYQLTGLTPSSSYEVRVVAKRNGVESVPSSKPYIYFYTLENPWVSHGKVTSKEAYVLWGPEVSTFELNIPNAVSYECWYRIKGAPVDWTKATWTRDKKDDAAMTVLNSKLSSLTASTTYEVRMRAVDASGGRSIWSSIHQLYTLERPWVSHAKVTSTEAYVLWGPEVNSTLLNIPNATGYEYQWKKKSDTTWTSGPQPLSKKDDGTMSVLNFKLSGLTASTTYEVRMRSLDVYGRSSDWAPTHEVYTLETPWVSHAKTSTNESYILWGSITSFEVRGATTYEARARIKSTASWETTPIKGVPRYKRDDGTMSPTLNIKLSTLLGSAPTLNATYEVMMRAVNAGGASDWSATHEVYVLGSPWVDHARVTSKEAYILWGPIGESGLNVTGAVTYECWYRIKGAPVDWTKKSWPLGRQDDPTMATLNAKLSGLTSSTTYEVQMRAVGTGGRSDWSTNEFYTLESPWVSHANVKATEAYILWGPEVSISLLNIPNAMSYEYQYRIKNGTSWTGGAQPLGKRDDGTMPVLNFRLTGLTASTTYEVRMRAVGVSGYSGWSATDEVYTLESPWVAHAKTTTNEAIILWGSTTSFEVQGAVSYEAIARIKNGTWQTIVGVPRNNIDDGTMIPTSTSLFNIKLSKLRVTPTTNVTYEVRMRAVGSGGYSEWSATHEVYMLESPWVAHAKTTTNDAIVLWGGTTSFEVQGAVSYEAMARIKNGTWQPIVGVPRNNIDDGTMIPSSTSLFNIRLSKLGVTPTTNVTYEVRMRAVGSGGYSEWSATHEVYMLGSPWVSHANVKPTEAYILWGPIGESGLDVTGATGYEYQYKRKIDTTWLGGTQPRTKRENILMNALNFKLSGLTASTTYEVRMRSIGSGGYSDWSATHEVYTIEAPWVSHAKVSTNEAFVLWGSITSFEVIGATTYEAKARIKGGASWDMITTRGVPQYNWDDATMSPVLNIKLSTLLGFVPTTGSTYEVMMRAVNAGGVSDWSATHEVYLLGSPWVDHARVTSREVYILWGPIGEIGPDVTGATSYEGRYRVKGAMVPWTQITEPLGKKDDTSMSSLNFRLSGLTPSVTYQIQMRAVGTGGNYSDWSATNEVYTLETPWVEAVNVTSREAYILWGPTSGGPDVPNAAYYRYQYKKTTDTVWMSGTQPLGKQDDTAMTALNFKLGSLTPSTTYEVQMRVVDASGGESDWSDLKTFRTIRGPWWLEVRNISYTDAILFWENVSGITQYELMYSKSPSAEGQFDSVLTGTTEYHAVTLDPNTTYYAKVRAMTVSGPSDWTDVKSFTTNPFSVGPSFISHYLVTSTEAVINWERNPSATSYYINYRVKGSGTWASVEAAAPWYDPSAANPNYRLSGLTAMSTYEIRVLSKSNTEISPWSAIHELYTLERPWVDYYKPTTNEVYVTWGPEVHTSEVAVPLSDHYRMRYRLNGGATVEYTGTLNNSSFADPANPKLNILFNGLTANSTYEIWMKTVDIMGGESDWTEAKTFHTIRGPWWLDVRNVSYTDAIIFWENVAGVTQYELMYSKSPSAEGQFDSVLTGTTEYHAATLDPNTMYYAKVRAITVLGPSDWTPVKSFTTSPFGSGPSFISHYLVASNEAVINWERNPVATSYYINYRVKGSGTWASVEAAAPWYNPSDTNPNYRLSGLTAMSTYEIRVLSKSNTEISPWSAIHELYTLERPWVDYYKPTTNEVYITWGPEVHTTEVAVPLSDHYRMRYRLNGGATVEYIGTLNNSRFDDAANPKLNILFNGLTANSTYEIWMKTVDIMGGESDWTEAKTFHTIRGPWWIDARNVRGSDAIIFWENVTGVTQYELMYSKSPSAEGQFDSVLTGTTEYHAVSLDPNTTYYAKVRAITVSGPTDWTPVKSFYTNPFVGPQWITSFLTTTTSTMVTWEGISGVTSYEVNYGISAEPIAWTSWAPSPQDRNYGGPITGLNPRTWYNLRVRQHTGADASGWSSTAAFYTIPAPNNVAWTGSTATTVSITWEPVDMGGTPAPLYEITWGLNPDAVGSGDAVTADIYYTMAGLLDGYTYYVKVRARESSNPADGFSDWAPYPALAVLASSSILPPAPAWVSHYLVTSHEAVVDWGSVAVADHYIVEYKRTSDTTWASVEILSTYQYNTSDPNPNYQLTGLSPSVTYQVRVLSKRGTLESVPSGQDTFYALEKPWLDTYKSDLTQAYVTWGPEVSTFEIAVPLSNHYDLQYRQNGGAWVNYTTKTLDNSVRDDATNLKLNLLLNGLTPSSTYEVRIRTVDGTGGVSDWSAIKTFHTIRGPWWMDVRNVTGTDAIIFWENVAGVTQYELMYSKSPSAEGQFDSVLTGTTEYHAVTLDPDTTYYAKVRAITISGPSDWTPVKSFFTSTVIGPSWISNYLTTTTSTSFTWEGVAGATYEVSYGTNADATGNLIYPFMPDDVFITGVSGLTPRTWYHAKVRAYTGTSESSWSPINDFFTIPAPNNVAWTGSTLTTVSITWEPVDLGGMPCTSYEVSWSLTPEVTANVSLMTGEVYATINGLTTGQTYYVKVRARDDADSGYSSWAPYPPLTVVATDQATVNDVNAGYGVTSGWRGTTVIIKGMNFGSTMGTVSFGSTAAQPGYWKNTEIAVSVPPTSVTGLNAITVVTTAGVTAIHVPSTFFFDVIDGGVVLDDFEGGVWQYSTCESGALNSVTIANNYTAPQERNTYLTVECAGSAAYEIVGGVSPYGDQPTENGIDLSSAKKIVLWFKGDGSTNVATFELTESNQAPGNNPGNPLMAEVWKYNVPISMSNTSWQQITIDLTTEGTNRFELDSTWYSGDSALDLSKIKNYQILTSGGNPKSYAIDYVFATSEIGGVGSKTYVIKYNSESENENWIAVPFSGTGLTDTDQLIQSVATKYTPVDGDIVSALVRDNSNQLNNLGQMLYAGGSWIPLATIPITSYDMCSYVISNNGRSMDSVDTIWP
jgi:hypothetical protein